LGRIREAKGNRSWRNTTGGDFGESDASRAIKELVMPDPEYAAFKALDPFFRVIEQGLSGLVDGEHYFDTIADDALFEFRYNFSGWPHTVRGRTNLMALYSGYGKNIVLHRGDALVVHPSKDGRVVSLEYEVHGTIVATGMPYDNRLIAVVTIENRKIIRWRDYMDSLAAWTALNSTS
jgi:ketosteroid isomerase-like protein